MGLRRVIPPATLPITVAEAKANGRIETDVEDAMIAALISAALAHAEMWTGTAFEPQTWELSLDAFPANEIMLSRSPVQSVTSIVYTDVDGAEQTVAPTGYWVDAASSDGWVIPVDAWPTAMAAANSVRVRFVAGAGTPSDVAQAILLLVEHWYEHRAAGSGDTVQTIPMGTQAILNLHRRVFV